MVDMVAVVLSILNSKTMVPCLCISKESCGARHGVLIQWQGIQLQGDGIRKTCIIRFLTGWEKEISLIGGRTCFCHASSGFSAGAGRARAPLPGRVGVCSHF